MYAVVQDRGHQYTVNAGDRVQLDRLDAEVGASIELPVLLLAEGEDNVQVGAPTLEGVKATCKVVSHERGQKGIAGVFRRRKDSRRRVGFRHEHTTIEVVSIA